MSLDVFAQMLTYRRPAGSKSERNFINRFIKPLEVEVDAFGNLWKRIGTAPVLWSSHTDTVHSHGGKQALDIGEDGWITAPQSNCLGADCTTGVYLMREMILRGVEGLYVFHRAEEIGGQGSSWIAKNNPGLLEGIKFAIAFDRKDIASVITHQFTRCCSDAFADSLIAQLDPSFFKDDGGTFTDTANYVDLIPECTNLSVGYFSQHTKHEKQHVGFALWLLDKMCNLDVSKLVSVRDPKAIDPDDWQFNKFGGPTFSYTGRRGESIYEPSSWGLMDDVIDFPSARSSRRTSRDHLMNTILDHPDAVASIFEEYGIASDDILHVANGGLLAAQ